MNTPKSGKSTSRRIPDVRRAIANPLPTYITKILEMGNASTTYSFSWQRVAGATTSEFTETRKKRKQKAG